MSPGSARYSGMSVKEAAIRCVLGDADITTALIGFAGPEQIDEVRLGRALYTDGVPDPDLLIRTSGEMRLSNFLLWQIAYTELWVTPTRWPDFEPRVEEVNVETVSAAGSDLG